MSKDERSIWGVVGPDYRPITDEDNELDRLMMQADLANKEARERFTCAVCNPDVPHPDLDWCNVCRPGKRKPAQEPRD